jgi:trans-aconitate methyltransferase
MKTQNPVDLLFADMEKLSPGNDSITLYFLRSLPQHQFQVVVDAGCGAGRQTMVLASEPGAPIQAPDSYQPFLNRLKQRAEEKGLAHLVHMHCMDMKDISSVFPTIDLLWAEGAAYNIGFADALTKWAKAAKPDGFSVVSELCWLREPIPDAVETLKEIETFRISKDSYGYVFFVFQR